MSKFINKYTIAIISFYIIWLVVLPFVLTKAVVVLCKNLSVNSSYEISVINPKIKLYIIPSVKFKANKINIKSKNQNLEIQVKDFNTKIRILPLISGHLHTDKISAHELNIKLNGINGENNNLKNQNFLNKFNNSRVKCEALNIDNFSVNLYSNDLSSSILYQGKEVYFAAKNRYLLLKTNSTLTVGSNISKIFINLYLPQNKDIKKRIFDVDIQNFNISLLWNYIQDLFPKNVAGIKGIINIKVNNGMCAADIFGLCVNMSDNKLSMIFPQDLKISSYIETCKKLIKIQDLCIKSDNINFLINGTIRNYISSKSPDFKLNVSINKTSIKEIINMIPPFKVEEFDSYAAKKYGIFGDMIGNLDINGKITAPDINGNVFIDNLILVKPIPNAPKGTTIKLDFNGKSVSYDALVPAGFNQTVKVIGAQELYNTKYADLTILSTPEINLHSAQDVVNPLHEILNFVIGPVPILDIYGVGNANLKIKGNRKYPHLWGDLKFNTSSVNFIDIPGIKLLNTQASLRFDNQNAVFKSQNGKVNGKDFKLNGVCDLSGKFDFTASSQNQPTLPLYTAIKTSNMLKEVAKMMPYVTKMVGVTDFNLKIYGSVKNIEDLKINKNAFIKGDIQIKNNEYEIEGINVNKVDGKIHLDGESANVELSAGIQNQPMSILAGVKNNIADVIINIPKFNPNFLLKNKTANKNESLPNISLITRYKGKIDNIEYDKLNLEARIISSNPNSILKFKSGTIFLQNGNLTVKRLDGYVKNQENNYKTDLKINNLFSSSPSISGSVKLHFPNSTVLNHVLTESILPQFLNEYLKGIEFTKGGFSANADIINNHINMTADLTGLEFNYLPLELPVRFLNGKFLVRNNNLKIDKMNILADNMPIFANGDIKDIFDKKNFNIYINSKPRQEFIDKYINNNRIYPVKIKGDIVYNTTLNGSLNDFNLKTKINLNKGSSIYYYGAFIGDVENAIVLNLNSRIKNKKKLLIKDFLYNKIISSQSGKNTELNMLKVSGEVDLLKNDLGFNNLKIKTDNPTDARIFNLIFGKPNIKQGQFTSDLKINGRLSDPKIFGDFHIVETNIPFLDTTMKNIEFLFRDKTIKISSKGEVLGNDISVNALLKNKLMLPYNIEKAEIYAKEINLDSLVTRLKEAETEQNSNPESSALSTLSLNSIVAENVKLKSDYVTLRNIHASNFEANTSLNEKQIFDIKDFVFNIAQGSLMGKYKINLKTGDLNLNLNAQNINANDITWALFDLNNQIYGDLTGKINISCNGYTFDKCMQTISGNTTFNVKNGRMPKLGSLEYLLKAGNLLKGGFTNLTINGIVDLITPLKTGDFSDIYGHINIKDGVADDIEITTQGKDLSLFIGGTYNFSTATAEMEVLGLLSRKITTMFGVIGNISVNTLFNLIPGVDLSKDSATLSKINKIPGIELSNKAYRKFIAEIQGNINGDKYVSSFKWIN